ncbi:hypothetical protein J6R97_04295 [bacterium]|nr:hypothetical protein [bacterium]
MKKTLILFTIILMTLSIANASEAITNKSCNTQSITKLKTQRELAFEKRLALSDEQKLKAKELRLKAHEHLKPVIEEIKSKKQEAKMVKMSRIAVEVQEERLNAIDKEIKILEKKAHDIKKANMKEFEAILTRTQRKTLKQMKKEGRQKYHATHPCTKTTHIFNK